MVFKARLLHNREGGNTERYVFGKLSARCFQLRPFCRYFKCGDIDHRKSAQGPVIYTVVHGETMYPLLYPHVRVPVRMHEHVQQEQREFLTGPRGSRRTSPYLTLPHQTACYDHNSSRGCSWSVPGVVDLVIPRVKCVGGPHNSTCRAYVLQPRQSCNPDHRSQPKVSSSSSSSSQQQ